MLGRNWQRVSFAVLSKAVTSSVAPRYDAQQRMFERRTHITKCPKCDNVKVTLGSRGPDIIYTCLSCSHEWAERRLATIIRHDSGRRDQAAHQAVAAICAARELEPLMATTRQWARRLTGADGVTFILRAGDTCYYAGEDAISPLWQGRRFPLRECVSGWVMLNRQSVMIPDIYADKRVPHDLYRPTFVKSMLVVPVRKADPIAAIGAYWSAVYAPTESHVQLVELLAEAAAVRLASEQLWARVKDEIAATLPKAEL